MDYLKKIQNAVAKYGTQKNAAAALGVSSGYLGFVLNGKKPVSLNMAMKIEDVFGLSGQSIMRAQIDAAIVEYKAQHVES